MTGNRFGISPEAELSLLEFISKNDIKEVHHGDCLGADKAFHDLCAEREIRVVVHPPTNKAQRAFCKSDDIKREKPYLQRNKDIVNETDMLIAFPGTKVEQLRSGTWSTVRYAKETNKPILIVYPDGSVFSHNRSIKLVL